MSTLICHLCLNIFKPEQNTTTDSKTFKMQLNFCLPMIDNIADDCILCAPCATTVKLAYELKINYCKSPGNQDEASGCSKIFEYVNRVMHLDYKSDIKSSTEAKLTKTDKKTGYTSIKDQQGEKIFSCNFCRFVAISKINMKLHVKQHVGETTYSCNFCDYKTQETHDYKEHVRLHFKKSRYICNLCKFATSEKMCIDKHMEIHVE